MHGNIRIIHPGDGDWRRELVRIGADPYAVDVFEEKREKLLIKVSDIRIEAANILKQDALSVGCDVAVPRSAISGTPERCSVIIIADRRRLKALEEKMKNQPFSIASLPAGIDALLAPRRGLFCAGKKSLAMDHTLIMGILNVTPDSFYDGGKYVSEDAIAARAKRMIEEGADIIDIGGETTRPGSGRIGLEEELKRIIPALEAVRKVSADITISVDTYKSRVAAAALDNGADIINDVSGAMLDPDMPGVVAAKKGGYVIMHMKGTPEDMQADPFYEDVSGEVYSFLMERARTAEEAGISPESIMVDPGIGFGKRLEDNLELIRRLKELAAAGYPVLVGLSMKSFLGTLSGRDTAERLNATTAAHALAIANGASALRVHDVAAALDAVKTVEGIIHGKV